jgi:hypothetical protein
VRCSLATGGTRGQKRPRTAAVAAARKVAKIKAQEAGDADESEVDLADRMSQDFWRGLHEGDRAVRREIAERQVKELQGIRVMLSQLTAAVEAIGRPLTEWMAEARPTLPRTVDVEVAREPSASVSTKTGDRESDESDDESDSSSEDGESEKMKE